VAVSNAMRAATAAEVACHGEVERQDLSRKYLAHLELERVIMIVIIVIVIVIINIIIIVIVIVVIIIIIIITLRQTCGDTLICY